MQHTYTDFNGDTLQFSLNVGEIIDSLTTRETTVVPSSSNTDTAFLVGLSVGGIGLGAIINGDSAPQEIQAHQHHEYAIRLSNGRVARYYDYNKGFDFKAGDTVILLNVTNQDDKTFSVLIMNTSTGSIYEIHDLEKTYTQHLALEHKYAKNFLGIKARPYLHSFLFSLTMLALAFSLDERLFFFAAFLLAPLWWALEITPTIKRNEHETALLSQSGQAILSDAFDCMRKKT